MRGNHVAESPLSFGQGSIPASAGQPPIFCLISGFFKVYPRECGATAEPSHEWVTGLGLSPRVRGNPSGAFVDIVSPRSIPASAGQPEVDFAARIHTEVYPRECGATTRSVVIPPPVLGLSPRVRGNHPPARAGYPNGRSIPASAGQPSCISPASRSASVYPRECGATSHCHVRAASIPGLSPRVRGNHITYRQPPVGERSIPASAGQPYSESCGKLRYWVYPRECGATSFQGRLGLARPGLSPRVRGNRRVPQVQGSQRGSIPASAGQPTPDTASTLPYPRECGATSQSSWRCPSTVYPRECGATVRQVSLNGFQDGLSPRVRGNLKAGSSPTPLPRSIPASAGQPSLRRT